MAKSSVSRPGHLAARITNARSKESPRAPNTMQDKGTQVADADQVPLQVCLPSDEVRAIKISALQRDMTISEFVLACFYAHAASIKCV